MSIIRFAFTFLITLSIFSLIAQTPLKEAKRGTEVAAAWPGCDPAGDCTKMKLDEFIAQNLVVPVEAKGQNAGGVVLVEFVIEKNGTIGEIKTFHDPGYGLGTAAYNVINLMKEKKIKWEPAEDGGKRVASRYMVPVSFHLPMAPRVIEEKEVKEPAPSVYDVVDVMPRYAGCQDAANDTTNCTFLSVVKHIQTHLKYPDTARVLGAQGPVIVQFIIDSEGRVADPVVVQGLGHGCDEEALRVISMMPAWQPGLQGGKPVSVRMTMPILFQLPKKEE